MACMLSGAVINTILDPLLIFQFNMGMAGGRAGYGAGPGCVGRDGAGLPAALPLRKAAKGDFALSARSCGRIARLGASDFLNQLAMMLVQIVLNNTMTYYGARSPVREGDPPLACAGIISKAGMIFFSIIIGISQGMQPIAGFNYGAKKYRRVMQAYRLGITAASVISVCGFLCFQLFPRQIIALFGSGSDVYFQFAERYFRIYMFATFLNGIQPITSKFFSSIGKAPKGIFLALDPASFFFTAVNFDSAALWWNRGRYVRRAHCRHRCSPILPAVHLLGISAAAAAGPKQARGRRVLGRGMRMPTPGPQLALRCVKHTFVPFSPKPAPAPRRGNTRLESHGNRPLGLPYTRPRPGSSPHHAHSPDRKGKLIFSKADGKIL